VGAAPPVSVVLPVRDGEAFLGETLDSLAAQTYPDFEIVVQDDGSTDGTADLLRAAQRRDDRITVGTGTCQGVALAANEACRRARGSLLVRIDGDDLARPERIACLVALAAEHPEAGFFASRVRFFPREAVGPGTAHYEAWLNALLTHEQIHAARFVEYPMPNPSVALRRAVFEGLGGYRQGPFPEDYDFFLRAASAGVCFAKHPDVLLDWREGAHRTTKHDPRYGLDRFHALKVEHLTPWLRRLGRPLAVVGGGRDGKRWARSLREVGLAPRWFVDVHPARIGQDILGARVVGYDDLSQLDGAFFLAAVGRKGARDQVRAALAAAGRHEERDMLCVQ